MIAKTSLFTLLTIAVLTLACGDDSDSAQGGAELGPPAGAPAAGSVDDTGPDESGPDAGGDLEAQRQVIVVSTITLEVDALRRAYERIGLLARSFGGFVAEGQLTAEGDSGFATLRLRVPFTSHNDLLDSLRRFEGATVKSEETITEEVTEEFTDLESRLRNLQRAEAQYQELLTRAGTIQEILLVTQELDRVRGEIERAQGRVNVLEDATAMADVGVVLTLPAAPAVTAEDDSGLAPPIEVLTDAFETSLKVAHFFLNAAIVLGVAAAWLVPAGALSILVWRRIGKQLIALGNRILSW